MKERQKKAMWDNDLLFRKRIQIAIAFFVNKNLIIGNKKIKGLDIKIS